VFLLFDPGVAFYVDGCGDNRVIHVHESSTCEAVILCAAVEEIIIWSGDVHTGLSPSLRSSHV
jgi:hypothetical protein